MNPSVQSPADASSSKAIGVLALCAYFTGVVAVVLGLMKLQAIRELFGREGLCWIGLGLILISLISSFFARRHVIGKLSLALSVTSVCLLFGWLLVSF